MSTHGQDSFVVEFVGLPGAGKSTLSHAVAELLRSRGIPVTEPTWELTRGSSWLRKRVIKMGYASAIALGHPVWTLAALRRVRATRQQSLEDLLATAFNLLFVCGLLARVSKRRGIHLMDQGFFHALWSIDFSARAPARLVDLRVRSLRGGLLTRADLVVTLEVPSETAVDRMAARVGTQSRLEVLIPRPDFAVHLESALAALERTRERLRDLQARGLPLAVEQLVDDGRGSLEEQARRTAELILRARERSLAPRGDGLAALGNAPGGARREVLS